jgi:hypothetical protein
MLARQRFDEPIDSACCSRIDVAVRSTDQQAAALSLELLLVSTPRGEKEQAVSVGDLRLTANMPTLGKTDPKPATETLRFDIPASLPIRQFDEIRVVFHLEAPRGYRSAKIAVSGFEFVRRGS